MISTHVKRSIGEKRYESKDSRTVLKRGLGGDSYSYFTDTIKAGQVIADRERERSRRDPLRGARLTSQKQQLELSLQRLKTSTITPPTPPRPVPVVKALPPVSFAEHQAAIEKAKAAHREADPCGIASNRRTACSSASLPPLPPNSRPSMNASPSSMSD